MGLLDGKLFGQGDPFIQMALSEGVRREEQVAALNDVGQFLTQANANDTAPSIELPQMRGGSAWGALGAALMGPEAAQNFARQQVAIQQANAQIAAQQELANQQQEGYLQRRRQEREELMAKLDAEARNLRSEAESRVRELGIKRGMAEQERKLEAARTAQREDALANSKWFSDHGMNFERLYAQIVGGVAQEVDPATKQVTERPLSLQERQMLTDTLMTMALTAPTDALRESLHNRIRAIDSLMTPPPQPPGPIEQAGVTKRPWYEGNRSPASSIEPFVLGKPLGDKILQWADDLGIVGAINDNLSKIGFSDLLSTDFPQIQESGPAVGQKLGGGLPSLNLRESQLLNGAREQVAKTK